MNKKFIVIGFLLICLLPLAGYGASLTNAHKDYILGNYKRAIKKARAVRESDESLYFLGLAHIKTGQYAKARVFLHRLVKRFPRSRLVSQAFSKLADTYFLQKDYDKAKELYAETRLVYQDADNMPLILLRLAQIASRQGVWQEKKKYLGLIKGRYPKSSEMKYVEVLEGYGDFFTIQVGAFGIKQNAIFLLTEIKGKYPAYMVMDAKGKYPIYRIRVGKYKTRTEVDKVSMKLLNEGYPAHIYP